MPPEIWAVWPSANPKLAGECIKLWKGAGYKTAVLFDHINEISPEPDKVIIGERWEGYPNAMNRLCREVPGEVVVCIGDDIRPPLEETPDVILDKFKERFPDTFGVMQPTGDIFASIDLCCPCPWVGRAFIDESYSGNGPYWEGYFHYFSDQEIQEAAILMDAFQQRKNISQYHDHWQRGKDGRPSHLDTALANHKEDKRMFNLRQSNKFPGHERNPLS